MHNKVIDLFEGNTLCGKNHVLRPSLFCFMHNLPTHNLYILSLSAFIACAQMEICDGHRCWRGLRYQQEPMKVFGEDATANFVVLDAQII